MLSSNRSQDWKEYKDSKKMYCFVHLTSYKNCTLCTWTHQHHGRQSQSTNLDWPIWTQLVWSFRSNILEPVPWERSNRTGACWDICLQSYEISSCHSDHTVDLLSRSVALNPQFPLVSKSGPTLLEVNSLDVICSGANPLSSVFMKTWNLLKQRNSSFVRKTRFYHLSFFSKVCSAENPVCGGKKNWNWGFCGCISSKTSTLTPMFCFYHRSNICTVHIFEKKQQDFWKKSI